MAIPVFIAETNSNRSARPANLRQVFAVIMRWKSRPWPEVCDSRTHASALGWQLSTWNGWTPMMSRSQMQLGGALGSMRPFVHEPFPRVISKQGRSPHPGHWTRWSDKTLAEKHRGNYMSLPSNCQVQWSWNPKNFELKFSQTKLYAGFLQCLVQIDN